MNRFIQNKIIVVVLFLSVHLDVCFAQEDRSLIIDIKTQTIPFIAFQDEAPARIVVENRSDTPRKTNIHFSLRNEFNDRRIKEWDWEGKIAAREKMALQIPDPEMFGAFRLEYHILKAGDTLDRGEIGYAKAMRSQKPDEDQGVKLGIMGIHRYGRLDQGAATINALGASISRLGVGWNRVEPEPGQWDFNDEDEHIEALLRYGIEPQVILTYSPYWAVPEKYRDGNKGWGQWATQPPINMEDWRKYVRKTATRYKGKVHYWEIWNEADWGFFKGSTQQYIDLLKIAYRELKDIDSKNQVLTSGFASADPYGGIAGEPDLQAVVLKDASDYFDYHAMHQHGTFEKLASLVSGKLLPYREEIGLEKPLYFNESSASTVLGKDHQASTIVKKVLYIFSAGSKFYDLFSYQDANYPFGIVEAETFYPRPSLPAYAFLSHLIQGKDFVKEINLDEGKYVYQFEDDKETVIAYWNQDPLKGRAAHLVSGGGKQAKTFDIFGNGIGAASNKGMLAVNFTAHPNYMVMPGTGIELQFGQPIVNQKNALILLPNKPLEVSLNISNPLSRKAELILNWSEKSVSNRKNETISLTPGENLSVFSEFQNVEKTENLKLHWQIKGSSYQGTLEFPILKEVVPLPDEKTLQPQFVADQREQVIDFAENDPTRSAQNWKGPEDLSASVWTWITKDTLYIEAEITDDLRMKSNDQDRLWKGESIQLNLDFPSQTGNWDFSFGRNANGEYATEVNTKVAGYDNATVTQNILTSEEKLNESRYLAKIRIPLRPLGIDVSALRDGFRMNMLFNEADGEQTGRTGYIRLADGYGGKKNTALYPLLIKEEN